MMEIGWLHCSRPKLMLGFLRGKISEGKLRRFKIACCRSGWHLLTDDRLKKTIEAVEAFTEGILSRESFEAARQEGSAAYAEIVNRVGSVAAIARAAQAACCAAWDSAPGYNVDACTYAVATLEAIEDALCNLQAAQAPQRRHMLAVVHLATSRHEVKQAAILRDIVGNPFRPVTVESAWLTPPVTALATAAYDLCSLPAGELDPVRLAVLADALEEAGCQDGDILNHLRGPGPHVRGCWAVGLVLGRA